MTGVRLGVELGAGRVRALLGWSDGTVMLLPLDGAGWLDVVVHAGLDGSVVVGAAARGRAAGDPAGLVTVAGWPAPGGVVASAGGREVSGTAVLAAVVRVVVEQARVAAGGPLVGVRVAVPVGWGPRRRTTVREVVFAAGLGEAVVLAAPEAVGWHLLAGGLVVADGAALLVCQLDGGCTASVLRRTGAGFEVLSGVDSAELPAADLVPRTGTTGAAVGGGPGVGGAGVSAVGVVAAVTGRAVAGAGVRGVGGGVGLAWVCCTGVGAGDAALVEGVGSVAGVAPVVVAEAELAVVLGALQAPVAATEVVPAPGLAGSVDGGGWRDVAAMVVPGLGSVALFVQFVAGAQRYGPRQSVQPGMVVAYWGGLAVASVLALLAAVAGMVVVTAARHDGGDGGGPGGGSGVDGGGVWVRHRLIGAALAGGGLGGLVVAAVYATLGVGLLDAPAGPLLRWSVLPVLPAAVAVVVLAVVVWWRPEPPSGSWPAWVRFPVPVVVLVVVGSVLLGYDVTGSPRALVVLDRVLARWEPVSALSVIGPLGRLGAAAVAVAVALLVVVRPWHRVLLAVPVAALVAGTLTWRSAGMLAVGVTLAVAGWWAARALWVLLRPLLLAGPPSAGAAGHSGPVGRGAVDAPAGRPPAGGPGVGSGWPDAPSKPGQGSGSRWAG